MLRRRKKGARELLVFVVLVLMFALFLPLVSGCNFDIVRERIAPGPTEPVVDPVDETPADTGKQPATKVPMK